MYCWGQSNFKDLGLNVGNDAGCCHHSNLLTVVSAGRGVVAYVQEDGESAFCLQDQDGKRKIKSFSLMKEKIHTLSCGRSHVVVVSTKGKTYQINCQELPSVPRSIGLEDKEVIQVSCGDNHSIALTKDGQVFTWGQNSSGQLGLGPGCSGSRSPQVLSVLAGVPLAQVSAGGNHSFALSLSGLVFGWGRNSRGQLGIGDVSDRHGPVPVKCLHRKKTVFISCGQEHSAALSKGGLVYTFGAGKHGQLGHNSERDELRPRLVAELWGSKVTRIACGRHHTLAYVASLKTIYACGRGKQGQLGNGSTTDQYIPLPVHLSAGCNNGIDRVVAGGNQSIAFCSCVKESKNVSCLLENSIHTIDDTLISKWLSKCDSKSWKSVKKEISRVFMSASCLNGSFLSQSHDRYYTSKSDTSGVDLSLARQAFEKLSESEKILNHIESVVVKKLLPSLCPVATGVEGLRVYLTLPELMRVLLKHQACRDLGVAFAEAVFRLHPLSLAALEGLWSELPNTFFKSLVKIFHSVSSNYLYQMRTECIDHWSTVQKTVQVLQKLYQVNYKAGRKIEDKNFYINEIKLFFQTFQKIHPDRERSSTKNEQFMERVYWLTFYPSIFDTETKIMIFKLNNFAVVLRDANVNPLRENWMRVRRNSLLDDTKWNFRNVSRNYNWPLKVQFEGEHAIDQGGVSQEFFSIIAREFHKAEPRMFEFFEESRLVWFTPEVLDEHDLFFMLGILCGMSLYNLCMMNLHFPLVLFKKLLGLKPTLEDLDELSPVEARCLRELLNEEEDFVEDLCLDFTARGHELVPNGREMAVTKFNRCQYVAAYVHFVFNVSVQGQYEQFAQGFSRGCPNEKWTLFLPEELMAVFCGNVNYEWEELKKSAIYVAYEATNVNIQNFWSVFAELSEQQKKNFLSFMTGSDRLPVGGLAKVRLKIVRGNMINPDDYYPVANTCSTILYLPNYSNIHILKEKFLHAIKFYEEFGER